MDITTDNNDPYVQLGVRIQRSQQEELDAWCKKNRLARSVAIRQAIDAYIKPPTNMASSLKQSLQVDEAKAIQADQLKAFRDQLEAAQKATDIKAVDTEARGALEALLARTEALETELAAVKEQLASGVQPKQAADGDDSFMSKFAK